MFFKYFSRQIKFSRTSKDSPEYRGPYTSDHLISNLLNEPLASLINLI